MQMSSIRKWKCIGEDLVLN